MKCYKIALLFLLFHFFNKSFAQEDFIKTKNQKLQELESSNLIYFEEGSQYLEFTKWENFWSPRLMPYNSFERYYHAEKDFYESSSYNFSNNEWIEIGPKRNPQGPGGIGIGPIEF